MLPARLRSSPTCTVSTGRQPRRSQATSKITGLGFSAPTSALHGKICCEKRVCVVLIGKQPRCSQAALKMTGLGFFMPTSAFGTDRRVLWGDRSHVEHMGSLSLRCSP